MSMVELRPEIALDEQRRRAAGRRLLEVPDMTVPGLSGLRDEIDALRARTTVEYPAAEPPIE
jgi:hypothetical protein